MRAPEHLERVTTLMKIDYLSKSKKKPRTVWWSDRLEKEEEIALLKLVNDNPHLLGEAYQALNLSERDLHKHTVIDLIPGTIEGLDHTNILLVYYHPKTNERDVFFGLLPSESSVVL